MKLKEYVIPFEFHPSGFVEFFRQKNVPLDRLLLGTGIRNEDVGKSGVFISYQQQSQIIDNGLQFTGGDGLGVEAGRWMPWVYYGSLASIVESGPSLAEAGAAFRRYIVITQPYYRNLYLYPDYYIDGQKTLIHPIRDINLPEVSERAKQFEFEYRLATTMRIFNHCGFTDGGCMTPTVLLQSPDLVSALNAQGFHSVKTHEPMNAIAAPHPFFTEQWRVFRSGAFASVLDYLEQEYQKGQFDSSFSGFIKWHIGKAFIRSIHLEEIAESVNMSPRSISRRLAQEGTSFRKLVQDVKMAIAVNHLKHSHLMVDELADMMGFSSGANLRRAVKNWCGLQISQIRPSLIG